jgi:hypothetical protein
VLKRPACFPWLTSTIHIPLLRPHSRVLSPSARQDLCQTATATPLADTPVMDPESCGCVRMGDGQLYQPVTCGSCGGSMRMYGIGR